VKNARSLSGTGGMILIGLMRGEIMEKKKNYKKLKYQSVQLTPDFHRYLSDVKTKHGFGSVETAIKFLINRGFDGINKKW
jgi:hypothetical protein